MFQPLETINEVLHSTDPPGQNYKCLSHDERCYVRTLAHTMPIWLTIMSPTNLLSGAWSLSLKYYYHTIYIYVALIFIAALFIILLKCVLDFFFFNDIHYVQTPYNISSLIVSIPNIDFIHSTAYCSYTFYWSSVIICRCIFNKGPVQWFNINLHYILRFLLLPQESITSAVTNLVDVSL